MSTDSIGPRLLDRCNDAVLGGPFFRVAHDGLDGHLFTPMRLEFCPRGVVFP